MEDASLHSCLAPLERWSPAYAARVRQELDAPCTVCILGRVGVGKSTLVNGWMGQDQQATGLGGITKTIERLVASEATTLLDTPGVDEPNRAITTLAEAAGCADVLVWVTDGLQPATRGMRDVLHALRFPNQRTVAVISRADLLGDELPSVQARIQALGEADDVYAADLRCHDIPLPSDRTSPTRLRRILSIVQEALQEFPERPRNRDEWIAELTASWTDAVHHALDETLKSLGEPSEIRPLERFAQEIVRSVEAVDETLRSSKATHPLHWPRPHVGTPTPAGRLAAMLGGQERAERHLQRHSSQLVSEGHAAILEWIELEPLLHEHAVAWTLARDRLKDWIQSQKATLG